MNNTQPFLAPIENPKGLLMKLVYYLTRRQLGKTITPVKVFSARLPIAFGMFGAKVYQLDKKLTLPKGLALLIRHQVARINICEFCMDSSRFVALKESMDEAKIDAINDYQASQLYSDAEVSALDYVTELVKDKKVDPQTFSRMAVHYTEREICEIIYLVSSEHLSNITNIGLNIHSDMLCDISKRSKAS